MKTNIEIGCTRGEIFLIGNAYTNFIEMSVRVDTDFEVTALEGRAIGEALKKAAQAEMKKFVASRKAEERKERSEREKTARLGYVVERNGVFYSVSGKRAVDEHGDLWCDGCEFAKWGPGNKVRCSNLAMCDKVEL